MKHLLTGLLALFVFAPAVRAEVIDAVLFNPSRLGRYENLKVSSELDASGGVNVQTATVQSHSAVNVNSPSGYNLENVSAHKVNLPNTAFQSSSFQAAGGKASFGSGEIQNLKDSAQKMRVKGKTVTVGKDVTVEMLGGEDSSNQEVKGLRLGGNDIPQPVSGCVDLNWYAQKAASGKEYKVLGFRSCPGGEGECTKTCGAGYTLNEEKCECEKNPCTKTCGTGYTLNEEKCECEKNPCTKTCGEGYTLNEETCECDKISCPSPTSTPSGNQSCTVKYKSYHNGQQSIPGTAKPEWDTQTCKWVYKTCTPNYNVWTLVDNPFPPVSCYNNRFTSQATTNSGNLREAAQCASYGSGNVSHVYYYPNGTSGNCGSYTCPCNHWMCTNISPQPL